MTAARVPRYSDARVTWRRLAFVVLPTVLATVALAWLLSGTPRLALFAGLAGAAVAIAVGLVSILVSRPVLDPAP